jgi:hypothetical protein
VIRGLGIASQSTYYPFRAIDSSFGEAPLHLSKLSLKGNSFGELALFVELEYLKTRLLIVSIRSILKLNNLPVDIG